MEYNSNATVASEPELPPASQFHKQLAEASQRYRQVLDQLLHEQDQLNNRIDQLNSELSSIDAALATFTAIAPMIRDNDDNRRSNITGRRES